MKTELPGGAFTEVSAYRKLLDFAAAPFDLSAPSALTPDRIAGYRREVCGWRLLYATQRVDDAVLSALRDLAHQTAAVARFEMLMAGEPMNRIDGQQSEHRRVLHTASRNLFNDLPDLGAWPGAQDAVDNARKEFERLRGFVQQVDSGEIAGPAQVAFTDMVNIGIGGSDLGPRALYVALQPYLVGARRIHFISNVDPDDAALVLRGLDLSRTLVNVVSKSGATLETRTNEILARQAFRSEGLDPGRHFVCVTSEGSPMDDFQRYLRCFYMHDYIGGRFSATSMAGALPLAFAVGMDNVSELLRGARQMDLAALNPQPLENLPLLAALLGIWNRNFLGLPTLAVLPYSQALLRFAAHLQQLDMESNGKGILRTGNRADFDTGPIVWGEPGTNGQHAFFQFIHQSQTVVPCEFIGLRKSQFNRDFTVDGTSSQQKLLANLLAQSMALATGREDDNPNRYFPGNRPSSVLIAEQLTPRALGALLAFYEAKVCYQGLIWNVNSFDQEGVQLGKVLADRLIDRLKRETPDKPPEGAEDAAGAAMLAAAGIS